MGVGVGTPGVGDGDAVAVAVAVGVPSTGSWQGVPMGWPEIVQWKHSTGIWQTQRNSTSTVSPESTQALGQTTL